VFVRVIRDFKKHRQNACATVDVKKIYHYMLWII